MKKLLLLSALVAYTMPGETSVYERQIKHVISSEETDEQKIGLDFSITRNGYEFAHPAFVVVANKNATIHIGETTDNKQAHNFNMTLRVREVTGNSIICEYFVVEINEHETLAPEIRLVVGEEIELPSGYSIRLNSINLL